MMMIKYKDVKVESPILTYVLQLCLTSSHPIPYGTHASICVYYFTFHYYVSIRSD